MDNATYANNYMACILLRKIIYHILAVKKKTKKKHKYRNVAESISDFTRSQECFIKESREIYC